MVHEIVVVEIVGTEKERERGGGGGGEGEVGGGGGANETGKIWRQRALA